MIRYILGIFFFFLSFGCNDIEKPLKQKDNSIDSQTVSNIPYTIRNESKTLKLSDTNLIDGSGKAVIDIFLDKEGNKLGFNIKFYQIFDKNGLEKERYFKYTRVPSKKEIYPKSVKDNFDVFQKYFDTIDIVKSNGKLVSENYIITISKNLTYLVE